MLCLSVIEGLYIIFMFNLFKTCKYIHHPFEHLFTNHPFLKHPISDSRYSNKICYFGKFSSFLLFIWLIIRYKIKDDKLKIKLNTLIWIIVGIVSFIMNMNAFIYLLPVFIIEIYLYIKIDLNTKLI